MTLSSHANGKSPLEGLTVFDFTRYLSGPFATMILRDLGARVIKFESEDGDPARRNAPFVAGESGYFHAINRGKESVVVDLRNRDQVAAILELVGQADCVIENFRPGVMDRLGLGPDTVRNVNPQIVYASCSGFGQHGPYASLPAFDIIVQAMGGVMSVTGAPDGPPTRVGVSQGDIVAGILTALAVVTALLEREWSGQGRYLDVSMFEAQMFLGTHAFGLAAARDGPPPRIGNRHPVCAPFDTYPTTDGYVAIAVVNDEQFRRLVGELGVPDLAEDLRFRTNEDRVANVDAITSALTDATRTYDAETLVSMLREANVPCGPVLDPHALLSDAHVTARGAVRWLPAWHGRGLPAPTLPFTADGNRPVAEDAGPQLGGLSLDGLRADLGLHDPPRRRPGSAPPM